MKAQRFKPGQEVVKARNSQWVNTTNAWSGNEKDPQFGQVLTVSKYLQFYLDHWFISFKEFPPDQGYTEESFEPLITDSVLEKELNSIPETVTA